MQQALLCLHREKLGDLLLSLLILLKTLGQAALEAGEKQ
jgi:hypothetical protein